MLNRTLMQIRSSTKSGRRLEGFLVEESSNAPEKWAVGEAEEKRKV